MKPARRRGMGAAILASATAHLAVLLLLWVTTRAEAIPEMRVYAVDIVSPPPTQEGPPDPGEESPAEAEPEAEEPAEEAAEPEPAEAVPEPEPSTPPPTRREPERERPKPAPQREDPVPPAREPARPPTGAAPDPKSEGGEDLTVKFDGIRCIDPDYCDNIIRQIHRYFRRPAGGAAGEADVYFVIREDGSVRDLRVISNTGGVPFRLAVLEAVEQAGRNRAFGRLPDAFGGNLPVRFTFRPAR